MRWTLLNNVYVEDCSNLNMWSPIDDSDSVTTCVVEGRVLKEDAL